MTSQQILSSDVIDILFEHRNKQYGAYQLRKDYNRHLLKSVAIGVGLAFLLAYLIPVSAEKIVVKDEKPDVVVHTVDLTPQQPKPEPPQPPKEAQTQAVRQEKFIDQFKITKNEVVDPVPTIDMVAKAAVSSHTVSGNEVPAIQPLMPEAKGNGNGIVEEKAPAKEEVIPDRQPQFPGGVQAWLAFLSRNLVAPESLESGEKRTVLIRFHVAEDGSITNFHVVRSAGASFDNEVIRVLKKMPKWTPAMQGGRPLPVSFTQPVTFVGLEE
ncbi:MAG TPA: energy transducer TonB [Flavisolibacter sp.]|nr:energy transducer TonB [Flavisolibacter sp.]